MSYVPPHRWHRRPRVAAIALQHALTLTPSSGPAYSELGLTALFALMHGDMIWDTYNDMIQIDQLAAQLYLYSYIFIATCVICNIFTIIIEEGYMK